jgi:hypothetical protein
VSTAVVTTKALCGAHGKQKQRPCRNRAGFRTDHVGSGRCYLHGGRNPVKHGLRSRSMLGPGEGVLRTEIRKLAEEHANNPDPLNLLPELAMLRALAENYIDRYEAFRDALLAWHESYAPTQRVISEEQRIAFEHCIDELENIWAEESKEGTLSPKQQQSLAHARDFVAKLTQPVADGKPRQLLDLADPRAPIRHRGAFARRVPRQARSRPVVVYVETDARDAARLLPRGLARRRAGDTVRQGRLAPRRDRRAPRGSHRGQMRNLIINMPPRHMKSPRARLLDARGSGPSSRMGALALLELRAELSIARLPQVPACHPSHGIASAGGPLHPHRRTRTTKTAVRERPDRLSGSRLRRRDGHGRGRRPHRRRRSAQREEGGLGSGARTAVRWWRETMSSRGNDPKTVARLIVMQRLHENATSSGEMIERGGYEHLMLPASTSRRGGA